MKVLQLLFITSLSFFLSFSTTSAQDITEGSRSFIKKESANALSIVVQGLPKNVETVMEKKLQAATGQKSKNMKGHRLYESARLADRSIASMDMYFRVERASKSDKNHSRVNLFISSGNNNFINSETNPGEMEAAKEVLKSLQLDVEIYELELAVAEQNKVIDKESKEHQKMEVDSVKLENKLAETIQAIENNKIDRKDQLELIEQERNKLNDFQDYLHQLQTNGYEKATDLEIVDEIKEAEVTEMKGEVKEKKAEVTEKEEKVTEKEGKTTEKEGEDEGGEKKKEEKKDGGNGGK